MSIAVASRSLMVQFSKHNFTMESLNRIMQENFIATSYPADEHFLLNSWA